MTYRVKSFFVGSAAFVLFAMLRGAIPLGNMAFYVISCAVFAGAALLTYLIMTKKKGSGTPAAEKIWAILPTAALSVWIILFYCNETRTRHRIEPEVLIRHTFPFPLWLFLMCAGTAACLIILGRTPKESALKLRKRIRMVVSFLFASATSSLFYAPNIFQDIQGGTYHSHAYTNSIINVCWMVPYSEDLESLYGHYAILFMPVLKLLHRFFGVDYLTGIFLVSAVVGAASILLFLYILDYFARQDLIFYLGMLAIGEEYFMILQGGVYLQVHPHRMIFPMLLAALALREYRSGKKHNILAVILLALSFVWSTEVGIVTMLSFFLYRWAMLSMDGKKLSLRKLLSLFRELALYVLLPFALSFGIINGYNLLAGGSVLEFSEFMFPLISDRGYIDKIELPLPDITHAWIGSTVLFMGFVCIALFQLLFPDGKKDPLKPFYFFLGIQSLGLMLYYINRPVEGALFIIMFLMLIMQAIILQKGQDAYLEWKVGKESPLFGKNRFFLLSLRVITVFLLFIMAFDSVYSMPKAFRASAQTVWKREELMDFARYVYEQIPPDAVSFGEGVPELMSMIDRDTHLHTTEWSYRNMPLDTMERIRRQLEGQQWFFCSLPSLGYLQDNYPGLTDGYTLHEVFEYNGVEFGFFRIN